MNILYIADPCIIGGATKSLIDVCTAMEIRGVKCTVCTSGYNDLNKILDQKGIRNVFCNYPASMDDKAVTIWKRPIKRIVRRLKYYLQLPQSIRSLEKKIDINEFDLIHTNSIRDDIGMALSKKYHINNIVHLREFAQEDWNWDIYRFRYIDFVERYTCTYIAISKASRDIWIKKGLSPRKIKVIYNGVEEKLIKTQRKQNLLNDKKLKLVFVGSICEAKGQIQALEALNHIPNDIRSNLLLDFIGWVADPEYLKKLQMIITMYGLQNIVSFLGSRNDVYDLLQNYHVGLMCSKSECFGRVTAEYMHANLGVIASNAAANPELIENDYTGLLYEPGNYEKLGECIIRFYNDRKLLESCAEHAREFAQQNFTKDINADKIYELYCAVLQA